MRRAFDSIPTVGEFPEYSCVAHTPRHFPTDGARLILYVHSLQKKHPGPPLPTCVIPVTVHKVDFDGIQKRDHIA
jgi:hypothetical protein